MNSQINPLRLNETTPNFYGICIIMPRIHLYKKVNFVKNVTRSCPDSDDMLVQNQNGTQRRKCMVSSHDLCLLLIAQALGYSRPLTLSSNPSPLVH